MAVRHDALGGDVQLQFEAYRRELTAYCYRMLASASDAEDAVQETMVRAWRAGETFEGRSSVRSWLYRIATNVCLDQLRGRQRRARPMEMGPSRPPVEASLENMLPEGSWVSPIADERVLPVEADPAEVAAARESIRLAFVAALQHLPARQRAVLILCQVLRWQATEVAELLGTTVAAVNSALQRARATLATVDGAALEDPSSDPAIDAAQADLLARYVDAFQRYDMEALVGLLHDDAIQSMPPFSMWLQGPANISRFMLGPGAACRGSVLVPRAANGMPAFGHYKPDPAGGYMPWALMVIDIAGDKVAGIHSFLTPAELFPAFGLPERLPAS
ncbi:MAG TPA: sigma-70 family RNA polymerase sigma factor [Acidimicrobiales bacterium]|nr:sigma-70 family RNA polymerase sigma factor [Acidimicrobiales bacterium]